jgi:hypothetical protein
MLKRHPLTARGILIACLLGTVTVFVAFSEGKLTKAHAYHSEEELEGFRGGSFALPVGANNYFMASGNCYGCHGPDVMNNYASVDSEGNDVNVADDWRSTMMANSARDPFWRAKVSHEVAVNPGHQAELEDKCTSCHAPMGRHDKFLTTGLHYSISEMVSDPVALDGVSCVPCHMQSADSLGLLFSGNMKFDLNNVLYGPYVDIFGSPMTSFVGYEPLYGEHINDPGLCAGCHTLQTATADMNGTATGDEFVEQATYHEWLNSSFNTNTFPATGVTCQGCHVPRIDDAVVISANYLFLQGKSPFGLHHFAGANTFMLKLLKDNILPLELTAHPEQFDSTIARTNRMLQQNTLLLEPVVADRDADTARIDVTLMNLAGHRFPSGYPARRAFVELIVLNADNDTMFRSGGWNDEYEVIGHDEPWEPHHDVIVSEDQAQIYELVMGDVNDNKTTVLERAKSPLKDNRLVPLGFSTDHISYDTTRIAGVPASDFDFNYDENGVEGSGTDIVHYRVPMNGYTGMITVRTKVWYQSAPPRWMEEMFAYSTPEIELFQDMYENADGTPVLVKEAEVVDLSIGIDDLDELGVRIYPNPISDGLLRIENLNDRIDRISVYDLNGKLIADHRPNAAMQWQLRLPEGAATYIVSIEVAGRQIVERITSLR